MRSKSRNNGDVLFYSAKRFQRHAPHRRDFLSNDKEDLIHKAAGWMLREAGKRNAEKEREFLNVFYKKMPRTMLRYAIEKFPPAERQKYLKGEI